MVPESSDGPATDHAPGTAQSYHAPAREAIAFYAKNRQIPCQTRGAADMVWMVGGEAKRILACRRVRCNAISPLGGAPERFDEVEEAAARGAGRVGVAEDVREKRRVGVR